MKSKSSEEKRLLIPKYRSWPILRLRTGRKNNMSEQNVSLTGDDRLIALADGSTMGDMMIVFATNAPIEELKELEKISNDIYINGGDQEDVPIWAEVLKNKGYVFDYVDEHQHITALGISSEWLEKDYPQITEHYCIENQPEM